MSKLHERLLIAAVALLGLNTLLLLAILIVGPPAKIAPLETADHVGSLVARLNAYSASLDDQIKSLRDLAKDSSTEDGKNIWLAKIPPLTEELERVHKDREALWSKVDPLSYTLYNRAPIKK